MSTPRAATPRPAPKMMPVIIVVPGIAAVVLAPELVRPDQAYPTMMGLLPTGMLGLVFAASARWMIYWLNPQ